MGPILSRLQLSAMNPCRLPRPSVGRKPVTPQMAEGSSIEPPVSVPIENPTRPAEVADAGPAEEPCDPIDKSQGFFVCPANHKSSSASSPVASFAINTPRLAQPRHHRCIFINHAILERRRPPRGGIALHRRKVLDSVRHAMQRSPVAPRRNLRVRFPRLPHG